MHVSQFQRDLLAWFLDHRRDLPWRRTRDPYAIWISETMLQQTRVSAVIPYFNRFMDRFPTVGALAVASEADLLAAWSGLGYYYRARNVQRAARTIDSARSFPSTYVQIRALPGVGDYTAAAVASIAFRLPHAVLDGNVLRVLSRVHADGTDVANTRGRKHFGRAANDLLSYENPGLWNEAVMELGATICLPKNPQCLVCPVQKHCKAEKEGRQNEFPVKTAKPKQVQAQRTIFWIEQNEAVLAWQRPANSRLMPGFWELPEPRNLPGAIPLDSMGSFRHAITVHSYTFAIVAADAPQPSAEFSWLPLTNLSSLPISTVFRKAARIVNGLGGKALAQAGGTP